WLKGNFLRVGPGKFDLGDFTLNHYFDGLALLSNYTIKDGKVSFHTRYLNSDAYKKACMAKRPIFTEFGTRSYPDPCKNVFSRMMSQFDPSCITDNCNLGVIVIEDEVYASTETCYLRKIDPKTLETQDKVDLNKMVSVNMASSHPLTDSKGITYNLGSSFMSGPKYHIIRLPTTKDSNRNGADPWLSARTIMTIPSSWRANYSYYHSFGMSDNYLIFLEQPLQVNTLKMGTSQVKGRNMHGCMEWYPQEKVKFHIIRKSTGELLKTSYVCHEPFFMFHHANAYEEDDQLIVDVINYETPDILDKLYLNKVRMNEYQSGDPPRFVRFVLPLIDNIQNVPEEEELVRIGGCTASAIKTSNNQFGQHIRVQGQRVAEAGFEMPVINPAHIGKHYRYVYACGGYDKGFFHNSICKVDVDTGNASLWRESDYHYPGEPVFIPAPDAKEEDDGIILTSVADVRKDHPDFLAILDARSFEEIGRAVMKCKVRNALHGQFVKA
ncbi:unnamed protein product, partial [Meganyctiphanes norvegica]